MRRRWWVQGREKLWSQTEWDSVCIGLRFPSVYVEQRAPSFTDLPWAAGTWGLGKGKMIKRWSLLWGSKDNLEIFVCLYKWHSISELLPG